MNIDAGSFFLSFSFDLDFFSFPSESLSSEKWKAEFQKNDLEGDKANGGMNNY